MNLSKLIKDRYLVFLLLIVIFGGILRLFSLSTIPSSLNWDEVSHGYNAFSILKTGKDQWGQFMPILNFRAYGDYPLPLNLYLTIPFVGALGLNEFSIRLPHAILGIGTIIATYFLVVGLTRKKAIALLSSFLVAIDPWTLFSSRFVLQSNVAVFFLTLSVAFFFNRDKRRYFLSCAVFCLGLTLYSYHTTRIISPLILFFAVFVYWKELRMSLSKLFIKRNLISTALIIVLFIPGVYATISPQGQARSNVVFVLNDAAVNNIIVSRQSSKLPTLVSKLIYNRPAYFIEHFVTNYLDYFSPEFLFFKGGTQYQFSVPGFGLLSLASLPFFYIGLVVLAKSLKDKKEYQLLAAWLFISPIPAAITVDKFAVIRSTGMLPLPEIISAIGLFAFLDFINKRRWTFIKPLIWTLFFAVAGYSLESYMATYIGSYNTNYSWSWQYGYKQVVNYSVDNYSNYDKIIVTKKYGEPHEFFLFYLSYDPSKYQSDENSIKFYQSNWYWVDHFDKFWFVNDWQAKDLITESKVKIDCKNLRCLLVTSPGNYPQDWIKIGEVDFLTGQKAFEYYTNK